MLRCVGTLAADKPITRPGGKSGWHNDTPDAQCQGSHTFRYAIFPILATALQARKSSTRVSEQFHLPFLAVRRKNSGVASAGRIVPERALPDRLVLSALKQSEEGDALIVRVYNPGSPEVEGSSPCSRGM